MTNLLEVLSSFPQDHPWWFAATYVVLGLLWNFFLAFFIKKIDVYGRVLPFYAKSPKTEVKNTRLFAHFMVWGWPAFFAAVGFLCVCATITRLAIAFWKFPEWYLNSCEEIAKDDPPEEERTLPMNRKAV